MLYPEPRNFSKIAKPIPLNTCFFQHRIAQEEKAFEVNGRNYYPLLNPAQRDANVKASDFIETVIKRRITEQYDKFLFKRLMLILRTDPEFNEMARGEMYQYIDAIRIESASVAEGEA